MIAVNAHDGPAQCQCENCRRLDDLRYPKDRTRRMFFFANDIAKRIRKVMPDKRVGLLIGKTYMSVTWTSSMTGKV